MEAGNTTTVAGSGPTSGTAARRCWCEPAKKRTCGETGLVTVPTAEGDTSFWLREVVGRWEPYCQEGIAGAATQLLQTRVNFAEFRVASAVRRAQSRAGAGATPPDAGVSLRHDGFAAGSRTDITSNTALAEQLGKADQTTLAQACGFGNGVEVTNGGCIPDGSMLDGASYSYCDGEWEDKWRTKWNAAWPGGRGIDAVGGSEMGNERDGAAGRQLVQDLELDLSSFLSM